MPMSIWTAVQVLQNTFIKNASTNKKYPTNKIPKKDQYIRYLARSTFFLSTNLTAKYAVIKNQINPKTQTGIPAISEYTLLLTISQLLPAKQNVFSFKYLLLTNNEVNKIPSKDKIKIANGCFLL